MHLHNSARLHGLVPSFTRGENALCHNKTKRMGCYNFKVHVGKCGSNRSSSTLVWLGLLVTTARSWSIPSSATTTKRFSSATSFFPIQLIRGGGSGNGDTDHSWTGTTLAATASSSETAATTTTDFASSSVWSHVELGPPDAILGIAQAYAACTDSRKVNVCVGAYRDEHGRPWILPTVVAAEARLAHLQQENPTKVNKEYLPIAGDAEFLNVALQFAYGTDNLDVLSRVAAVQTLSGTGACRIGGAFLGACWSPPSNSDDGTTNIYIPVPTWGNHWKIFGAVPNLRPLSYRYYNAHTNRLDINGLLEDLQNAPMRSIVVLHACAHNPTGCDPSREQWHQIASVLQERRHVAFVDSAYQGFASGDAERDAWAVRYLVSLQQPTIPVLLAQSFAKNFGLYGERCGTLSVVCANAHERERIVSQLQGIIRPMYSSPPKHGSSIVKTILNDADLRPQYYTECAKMAARIAHMRVRLVQELVAAGSVLDWSHVLEQIGMFAYTGMNSNMCDALTQQYAIFLTRDGRISLAGLTEDNLPYVAQAIHTVTHGQAIHAAAADSA
jgi:aspartate aminotransferase, mitochondrial